MLTRILLNCIHKQVQEHRIHAEELNQEVTCYSCILITAAKVASVDDTNNKDTKK